MKITGATSLVFDHVRCLGVDLRSPDEANTGLTFLHSAFDGGRPSWFFRDDGKTKYRFMEEEKSRRTTWANRHFVVCSFPAPSIPARLFITASSTAATISTSAEAMSTFTTT